MTKHDLSTWSEADHARASQTVAALAELLGCAPAKVLLEVQRLKRAADPSILADLGADDDGAPSLPYLAKTYQWAALVVGLREAFAENLPGTSAKWQIGTGQIATAAIGMIAPAHGRTVLVTVYQSGKVNTGGPEGELRADVRAILASLGFDVRC